MKKILKGNVITGAEKLFLQFELGKKKYGIEKLFLEDSISANNLQQSETNNIKMEYVIKDDDNEEIVKGDNAARIGTTLINFMNRIDKIYLILHTYLELIQNFDINTVQELYTNIEAIINEFKLRELEIDYEVDEALIKIYQEIASEDDEQKSCKQLIQNISQDKNTDKELLHILKFIEKLFGMKNNNNYHYYNRSDFIWIATEVLGNNDGTIQNEYNFLLFNVIKKLENRLTKTEKENEALKSLIHQIFNNFYVDYYLASNPNNLYRLLTNIRINMQNNPYNTYYKNMYKYISSIENKKTSNILERFEKFSLQEMAKVFIKTLVEDISYISNNYKDVPEVITNAIIVSKNTYKYEIASFYELFYISKYYILKDGNNLTACNLCGKYFITQGKVTEQHCRRIYRKGLNCCEYVNYNTRKSNSSGSQVSKEKNAIKSMLRRRDFPNNTSELTEFNKKLSNKISEINLEKISLEKRNMKLLEWLRTEHKELKKYK